MSGPERRSPDDRLLEDFLDGQGEVVRAYRATTRPTAPPELEPAVLQIARDALGRPVIRQRLPPRRRWPLAVAVAASLMLSLGVLLNLQQDRALSEQVFDMAAAMPAPLPQPKVPLPVPHEAVAAAAAVPSQPASVPRPPVRPRADAARAAGTTEKAKRERRVEPPVESESRQLAQEADVHVHADADIVAAAPPPAQAPPLAERRMAEHMSAASMADTGTTAEAFAPPPQTKSAREVQGFAPSALQAAPSPPEPVDWLRRIAELRERAELEAARRELVDFRKAYPEYPVPEDLKPLLP